MDAEWKGDLPWFLVPAIAVLVWNIQMELQNYSSLQVIMNYIKVEQIKILEKI